MARKNRYEFRPDKVNHDTLGKLLLTRQQFRHLLRWLLLGALCLAGLVLQDVVMSRVHFFGATTDLAPLLIFAVCILHGGEDGCVFALAASLIYYFSGSAPGPYCIVLITFLGVLASIFRQAYLRKGFSALMLCSTLCVFLYETGVFLIGLFLKQTYSQRFSVFLLTAVLTTLCLPVVYPILRSIGKIGGETWKE
jgi:rod shape-determining protein MreD